MNHPIKKLAGETAIYGLSTILARVLNFLFVPVYTYLLSTENYGIFSEFLAYIAVAQIVLTMGLETGCFRFASKTDRPDHVFSNALITTGLFALAVFTVLIFFSGGLSTAMGYGGYAEIIIYMAGILAIDSYISIPFAKLRFENKSIRFVALKSMKILSETGFNLLLLLGAPAYISSYPDTWLLKFISPSPDFTYPMFAIFLSAVVSLLIMLPDILKIKLSFTSSLWKDMMKYSLPIMIAGLPGILNDMADRLLFRFFSPAGNLWRSDLGVFQAGVKVATIMMLFIQMFRYAAEPFFFNREKERDSKRLYAKVMEYFTAFGILIFLGVLFYMDIIQYLLERDFRAGLSVLPIMLLAYLVLGMNFNVSMWYKLSGKTAYALPITLTGLVMTIFINVLFMPLFSYQAAAWGHLTSYSTMLAFSLYMGNKYYPIPYRWSRIMGYIIAGIVLYLFVFIMPEMHFVLKYTIRTLLILLYICIFLKIEKISVWKLKL